ncbi:phosphoribosylanthranilate isomerase [Aquimarina agarivorans]|uniref:phosphoribosylanthranilate isomerase n=1 Tax=Aquimarina agarivorans TaxID=980584 RepID=UPI0018723A3B|nr:phosphoribosylanthranilate isomerase [Aquimarina agarivorans]
MKYATNIQEVAALQPDYLGFIFYPKSPRNFEGAIPEIDHTIKKTGVFVDAEIDFIFEKVKKYDFKAVQLHGSESPEYCKNLREKLTNIEIFKVFGIKDAFDFSILASYEWYVNYFLFDTKGKQKGGNGYAFDWSVLKNYTSKVPIILSGGIGIEELSKIEQILKTDLPIYALDLNSKFEITPGVKDAKRVKEFLEKVEQLTANS